MMLLQNLQNGNAVNVRIPIPSLHDSIYLVGGFIIGVVVMTVIYERDMAKQRKRHRKLMDASEKEREDDSVSTPRRVKRFFLG
jgi:hypothetical protein